MRDTPYVGRRYPRVEDWALVRGAGRFVDDLHPPSLLEAAFLRSPTAHGLIRSINTSAAQALPGVHAVYTLADLRPVLTADRLPLQFPSSLLPPDISPFKRDRWFGGSTAGRAAAAAQQTVAPQPDALPALLSPERQVRVIAIARPDQPNVATTGLTPRAAAQPANAPQGEAPAVRPVRAIERPDRTETNGSGGLLREATRDVASDAETDNETAPAGCNVAVCRQFYRSFDAPTCTYRSYQGTTKHCAR